MLSSDNIEFEDQAIVTDKQKIVGYDPKILPILEDVRRAPKQENDSVILIAGRPGVGKSVLAQQLAYNLDPGFCIDQIVFTHEQLIDAALKLKPGSAIIWDEAREGTESIQAMTQKNQRVGLFLDTVRSKCLFIFLIQPSYWNFQMSIATERGDIFLRVFKSKNPRYDRGNPDSMPFNRGYYEVFNFDQKKTLYIKGKKFHTYDVPIGSKPLFCGFGGRWVVDKAEYQKRKDAAVAAMNQKSEEKNEEKDLTKKNVKADEVRRTHLWGLSKAIPGLSLNKASEVLGENRRLLYLAMDLSLKKQYDVK